MRMQVRFVISSLENFVGCSRDVFGRHGTTRDEKQYKKIVSEIF